MPREIVAITFRKFAGGFSRGPREFVQFAFLGMRQHQRPVFGANGVVRRHHAGLTDASQIGAVNKIEHGIAGAKVDNQSAPGALRVFVLQAAGAPHDRSDRRKRRDFAAETAKHDGLAVALDKLLGERHHLDHALIRFARALAEGDDAVLAEDEPVAWSGALENLDCLPGKAKARHEIGYESEPSAENFRASLFAVRLVDDAEYGGGVRMVDEFVRQERVQHDLDGRIWRRRIDQVGAFDRYKFLVRNCFDHAQAA